MLHYDEEVWNNEEIMGFLSKQIRFLSKHIRHICTEQQVAGN